MAGSASNPEHAEARAAGRDQQRQTDVAEPDDGDRGGAVPQRGRRAARGDRRLWVGRSACLFPILGGASGYRRLLRGRNEPVVDRTGQLALRRLVGEAHSDGGSREVGEIRVGEAPGVLRATA